MYRGDPSARLPRFISRAPPVSAIILHAPPCFSASSSLSFLPLFFSPFFCFPSLTVLGFGFCVDGPLFVYLFHLSCVPPQPKQAKSQLPVVASVEDCDSLQILTTSSWRSRAAKTGLMHGYWWRGFGCNSNNSNSIKKIITTRS